VAIQNGTQAGTLTTADFDSCQPLPSAGGGEFGHTSSWSVEAWNIIDFNALGKSNINKEGETKICARDYTYDYLDSSPGQATSGVYFADNGNYIPYLNITYSAAAGDTCDTCTIDCTENCVVDSALDCGGNPLTFTGAGTIGIQANITNWNKVLTDDSGCGIICDGGCMI